jgi:hypothetical protein
MLGWARCSLHKKHVGTRYVELVILLLVGSAGNVVLSGVNRARNIDALFFMPGWDRYGYDKKRAERRYAELVFLHPMGSGSHKVNSGAYRA